MQIFNREMFIGHLISALPETAHTVKKEPDQKDSYSQITEMERFSRGCLIHSLTA